MGPEHSYLKDTGRAEYVSVTDEEALEGFKLLARTEGILPALESSHAIAQLNKLAPHTAKRTLSSLTSPAGATKTWKPWQRCWVRKRSEQ